MNLCGLDFIDGEDLFYFWAVLIFSRKGGEEVGLENDTTVVISDPSLKLVSSVFLCCSNLHI